MLEKKLFIQMVMRHWHRLSKVVDALSLEALKFRLEGAIGSQIQWLATLPLAGGLEICDL